MENRNPSINLEHLKAAINAIFDHMTNDLGLSELELTENFYQEIPTTELYNVGEDSVVPTVGSLVDDLAFLMQFGADEPKTTSVMLLHVAPLMRFIAQSVGQ